MKKFVLPIGVVATLIIVTLIAFQVGQRDSVESFALTEGEKPSWNFEGPYSVTEELLEVAHNERERLEGLLGNEEFSEYDVQVGIAGQYTLVGEGKKAYEHLLKAIELNDARSLAYGNLGHLLGKVGARESAKRAYEMALDRDDTVQNRIQYIQHLEQYFGDDLDLVESAHTFAIEKFPNSLVLQQRYESWKKLHDR